MNYKKIEIKEDQVTTQLQAVKWHLKKFGSITSWEAIKEYGITRLSHHVFCLRKDNYNIISVPLEMKTRFGRTTVISRYEYIDPKFGIQSKLDF